MACACGIAVANIYYNQPMIGILRRVFPGGMAVGLIPTVTQLGYAAGLFFLVPLGDLLERRRLITAQFMGLVAATLMAAAAPSGWALVAASLLIGVGSTVAQQILPVAASLASDHRRGAVVGGVMSGLLTGILLSRTLSGFVAAHWGWRSVFRLAVPMALAGAAVMRLLPASLPSTSMGYGRLLGSLLHLWRGEPRLRRATLTQALLFAAFSAFWTTLALHLEQPPFLRGADLAGLFGVIGAIGILAAPLAGRVADRRGPGPVVTTGAGVVLAGWLLLVAWDSLVGMAVGVVLLDFGVQSALIAHQQLVFGLRAEARNRLNTLFMTGMFLGGSAGSSGAMVAWRTLGWHGVGAFGILLALAAAALQFSPRAARS
ncbi:MFS transporter [Mesoterricola silvestris]